MSLFPQKRKDVKNGDTMYGKNNIDKNSERQTSGKKKHVIVGTGGQRSA